ncbi:phthiocerol/phthiodiolone dimycocerosyl transferase family protein [Nocardia paucivorans]|uniref:phthiocerol/phthiodiolone dimycocerosyl transferase family protein n=1 Tax=Nocardia paucivorans TaxID=114259 RepID=UPI00068751D8|nr:acyltransferase [Nocardia paucivorans]
MWDQGDAVRMLAPSEQRFVRHGTYTGRTVSVIGRLDIDALRIAFAALRQEYPILVCRIGIDAAGYGHLLRPSPFGPSGLWVGYGDPTTVRLPAAQLDPGEQLAYLDVVCSSRPRARVTLFVHHAVADGGFCVELFARLWDHYTSWMETGTAHIVRRPYPEPLERHLELRGITRGTRSGLERATHPLPVDTTAPYLVGSDGKPAEPGENSLVRPWRLVFDRADTSRIVEWSRAHRLTVNALLTAAVLRAYASVTGPSVAPVHLGCLYPVDLRSRLAPPVPVAAGTNMGGLASFADDIDESVDLVELARRVATVLRDDLADGVVAQSALHFPDHFGPSRIYSSAGHIALTNTGVVPAPRTPAGLRITDYEIVYLSAHPRPSQGASAAVTVLSYTFAGRLAVAVLGGPDPGRLLDTVATELGAPVHREEPPMAGSPIG